LDKAEDEGKVALANLQANIVSTLQAGNELIICPQYFYRLISKAVSWALSSLLPSPTGLAGRLPCSVLLV
jgi:hypothetical protein